MKSMVTAVPANGAPAAAVPAPGESLLLSAQLCFALYSATLGMQKAYRPLLRELDLTYPQYLVMLVLWERDGINVSEICDRLFLETATLTPLLKRLETRGYVRRQRSSADERQVIVRLTDEGRALHERALSVPQCIAGSMATPPEELAALRDRLLSLRDALFASGP